MILGVLIAAGVLFGDKLQPWLVKAWEKVKTWQTPSVPVPLPVAPGEPTYDRKGAMAKYDDCIAFLEGIGCKEGVSHLKAGLVHFYHEHP
jgi:hypothetical protein